MMRSNRPDFAPETTDWNQRPMMLKAKPKTTRAKMPPMTPRMIKRGS